MARKSQRREYNPSQTVSNQPKVAYNQADGFHTALQADLIHAMRDLIHTYGVIICQAYRLG